MANPPELRTLESFGAERTSDTLFDPTDRNVWLNQMLMWAKVNLPQNVSILADVEQNFVGSLRDLIKKQEIDQLQIESEVGSKAGSLFGKARSYMMKHLRKAGANLFQGRKKRKSLTILGSMGAGAAIGFILGTFVFPGVGTAVGGILGGAISGTMATIVGSIALTTFGAALGTWFGRRIAKRFTASKSDYKIKSKLKSILQAQLKLSEDELIKVHAYLVNRTLSMKDPILKQALDLLNRSVFEQGSKEGINRLALYLAQEFQQLLSMKSPHIEHVKDLEFIGAILNKLIKSPLLPDETKGSLGELLERSKKTQVGNRNQALEEVDVNKIGPNQFQEPLIESMKKKSFHFIHRSSNLQPVGTQQNSLKPLSMDELTCFEQNLQSSLMEVTNKIKRIEKNIQIGKETPGNRKIQYTCKMKDGEKLKFTYKEATNSEGTTIQCYTKNTEAFNRNEMAKMFAIEAKVYLAIKPEAEFFILSGGDKAWAVDLMAEALKEGLNPQLDDQEFPKEQEGLRQEIISQAYVKAGLKPKRRFGFRLGG